MPNLDTLDTLIAIVIVLLVLSMVVQSIQTLIKKLLKLKSRQLEESLVDLFENALGPANKTAADRSRLPTLRLLTFKHPAQLASEDVQKVFGAVMKQFKEIGRVASSGNNMLDSISKEDLMKVLRKVAPDSLLPNLSTGLAEAFKKLKELEDAFTDIRKFLDKEENKLLNLLGGDASAKYEKLRDALAPIFNDVRSIFSEKGLNANLLLADLMNLREVKAQDLLDLLGAVQQAVGTELGKAEDGSARKEALSGLDAKLKNVAMLLGDFREKFDASIAPLRVKLREVENWFDTVMQSFEERYNRGMKTYAFVISLLVVIWLNANLFNIYRDVSTNADKRTSILRTREDVLKRYEERLAEARLSDKPEEEQKIKDLIAESRKDIEADAASYAAFGFRTFDEEFKSQPQQGNKLLYVLLWSLPGWLLTAALLSVGAPFWQDVLESLFGVKNLLRKRGDIKNVEKEAGAGQPKP